MQVIFNLRLLEGDPVAKLYYQRRWILIIELAPRSVEALPGQGWLTGVGPDASRQVPRLVAIMRLLSLRLLMMCTPPTLSKNDRTAIKPRAYSCRPQMRRQKQNVVATYAAGTKNTRE